MKIWFDMDGTIADLYGVTDWLPMLRAYDPTPYAVAKPLISLSRLARTLNHLQTMGHEIGVISWLSRESNAEYDRMVTDAKRFWLHHHMPSVHWNNIHIVAYGRNKWEIAQEGIIFDDDLRVHATWEGEAYTPDEIFQILNNILKAR